MKILYHRNVLEDLSELSAKDQARILQIVNLFENYGFHLGIKYLKKLDKDIWELRTGRYRLLFGIKGQIGYATMLFFKKSQKTPKKILKLAVRRLNI